MISAFLTERQFRTYPDAARLLYTLDSFLLWRRPILQYESVNLIRLNAGFNKVDVCVDLAAID